MATSKAQIAAVNRYNQKTFDRFSLMLKKGRKAEIKAHAESLGESMNQFINRAIEDTMQRDQEKELG